MKLNVLKESTEWVNALKAAWQEMVPKQSKLIEGVFFLKMVYDTWAHMPKVWNQGIKHTHEKQISKIATKKL